MRLDKFLSATATCTRSEAKKAVRAGGVFVNGKPAAAFDMTVDPAEDVIFFRGERVLYAEYHYILLNKPEGVISATEDGNEPTVLSLLPEKYTKLGLFPAGRLDKNTTGLMLLTDDGTLAHRLLSPAKHVDKTYVFTVKFPLSDEDTKALESGVDIGGYRTRPATVRMKTETEGEITIHEGRYHQIKLMMEARHNQIRTLQRIAFGPLRLPPDLAPGEWRELTEKEIALLTKK